MRIRTRQLAPCLLAMFAAGLWASIASASTIIDHFDQPPLSGPFPLLSVLNSVPSNSLTTSGLDVLGGTRIIQFSRTSSSGSADLYINNPDRGSAHHAFLSSLDAAPDLVFQYGSSTNQLGSALLGGVEFVVGFDFADHDGKLQVTVASSTTTHTETVDIPAIAGPSAVAIVPFSLFTAHGINFNNVSYVKFEITGPEGFDTSIDYFKAESIPLPASAWAGGAVLCLIVGARVRRLARASA